MIPQPNIEIRTFTITCILLCDLLSLVSLSQFSLLYSLQVQIQGLAGFMLGYFIRFFLPTEKTFLKKKKHINYSIWIEHRGFKGRGSLKNSLKSDYQELMLY